MKQHPWAAPLLSLTLLVGCVPATAPGNGQPAAFPSERPTLQATPVPTPTAQPTPTALPDDPDFRPTSDLDYEQKTNWLSHPSKAPLFTSVNYIVVNPDGSLGSQGVSPINTASGMDVFFVAPTGPDDGASAGNLALDDQDEAWLAARVKNLAGPFAEFGRVFAPKYRQVTRATLVLADEERQARLLDKACTDVMTAFQYYLDHDNKGKQVLLLGDEQGSLMIAMLLRKMADRHRFLREKVKLAVLGGMNSNVMPTFVPQGQTVGGWWEGIPVCREPEEAGCVLAWQVWKDGQDVPATASNSIAGNDHLVSKGFMYRTLDSARDELAYGNLGVGDASEAVGLSLFDRLVCDDCVSTDLVAYENHYRARWQAPGLFVLRANALADSRTDPLPDEEARSDFAKTGYREFGFQVLMGRVLDDVRRRLN